MDENLNVIRRWVGDAKPWIEGFLKGLSSASSVVVVVVLGSAIRDLGHRRSDVDFMLLYSGSRPKIRPPIEVDMRLYSADDIDSKILAGHEVICWALKFGIPIYDPNGFWDGLVTRWKDCVPFPSSTEAKQRAIDSLRKAKEMLDAGDGSAADDLLLASATQFVRSRLIESGIFPASRPELPNQLRNVSVDDPDAQILEDLMYKSSNPDESLRLLVQLHHDALIQ